MTTAYDLTHLLAPRFPSPGWIFLPELADHIGYEHGRKLYVADAVAFCPWPSRGFVTHGFEMKVSRSDWLRELKNPAKADGFGKYCVGVDTRVLTLDLRWVPVGQCSVGDALVGFDEHNRHHRARSWRPTVITGIRIEKQDVWRVSLASGTQMLCTGDHGWLASVAPVGHWDPVFWIQTHDMAKRLRRRNCKLYLPRYVTPWSDKQDYGTGFLAGAFDGEGCLQKPTQSWKLRFAQRPNAMLDAVHFYLRDNGFAATEALSRKTDLVCVDVNGGFQELARFLGQVRPPRLLGKWVEHFCGVPRGMRTDQRDQVLAVEPVGQADIAVMSTSTQTFIAEGYGAHNCHYWWLVVSDPAIVKDGELPDTWGLMLPTQAKLQVLTKARRRNALPMDPTMFASILRVLSSRYVCLSDYQDMLKAEFERGQKEGDTAQTAAQLEELERRVGRLAMQIEDHLHKAVRLSRYTATDIQHLFEGLEKLLGRKPKVPDSLYG